MDGELALQILVGILSVTLFVALVVAIIVGTLIYKLVKLLQSVAEKGEHLVDSAEETVSNIKQNVGAVGLIQSLTQIVRIINKSKRRS